MDSNANVEGDSAPEALPSPAQDSAGYNSEPSVHEFDTQVNLARRIILTLFPPILLVLLTAPMTFKSYRGHNSYKLVRWGEVNWYWPVMILAIGFYLWHLWAPHRLARMDARK